MQDGCCRGRKTDNGYRDVPLSVFKRRRFHGDYLHWQKRSATIQNAARACELAGIPSVVYGFFGLVVIVPMVRELTDALHAVGDGTGILTASILLGLMILPTIIGVSESAIRAVPESYYEGSLALGADPIRSVFFATLPAAKSGIMAGVILGIGRAIGETMAVIMIAGNQPRMPKGILQGVRTLTTNIAMEMGYAQDLHREALIATGVVLFVFVLIINLLFSVMKRRNK